VAHSPVNVCRRNFAALPCEILTFSFEYQSRGSVVTHLRCDGIFSDDFIADVLLRMPAKEYLMNLLNLMAKFLVDHSV